LKCASPDTCDECYEAFDNYNGNCVYINECPEGEAMMYGICEPCLEKC